MHPSACPDARPIVVADGALNRAPDLHQLCIRNASGILAILAQGVDLPMPVRADLGQSRFTEYAPMSRDAGLGAGHGVQLP